MFLSAQCCCVSEKKRLCVIRKYLQPTQDGRPYTSRSNKDFNDHIACAAALSKKDGRITNSFSKGLVANIVF